MQNRSSKKKGEKDINETAFSIVQMATGQIPKAEPPAPPKKKKATAITLGRMGKQ